MPERDYRPISCSLYDVLEAAALKKRMLTLTIDGQELTLVIDDVFARGKEEFLDGTNPLTNKNYHLRLDAIQEILDPSVGKTYLPDQC